MKVELFPFQNKAVRQLRVAAAEGLGGYRRTGCPQVVSFTAPTGAGKTIILAALLEDIYYGTEDFAEQPEAIFVWLSDSPELNEQSKLKIDLRADKIRLSQCVTVSDDSFDRETFEDGHIYFLNTQKLGKGSNLTKHSDSRQYTIWETLENTLREKSDRLYVVIDEAHRGMRGREVGKATTIMQKFIMGSVADRLAPMPLIIGMSATTERFNALVGNTSSTVHKVVVSPDEVRASGLLKDRIIISYPEESLVNKDMAVLQAAARFRVAELGGQRKGLLRLLQPLLHVGAHQDFLFVLAALDEAALGVVEGAEVGVGLVEEAVGHVVQRVHLLAGAAAVLDLLGLELHLEAVGGLLQLVAERSDFLFGGIGAGGDAAVGVYAPRGGGNHHDGGNAQQNGFDVRAQGTGFRGHVGNLYGLLAFGALDDETRAALVHFEIVSAFRAVEIDESHGVAPCGGPLFCPPSYRPPPPSASPQAGDSGLVSFAVILAWKRAGDGGPEPFPCRLPFSAACAGRTFFFSRTWRIARSPPRVYADHQQKMSAPRTQRQRGSAS